MKTDVELQKDVIEELKWEPRVKASEVGVSVQEGIATLSGYVGSYDQKVTAEKAAMRVYGIKAVAGEIKVRVSGLLKRTDEDIAHAAADALSWDISVPEEHVKARVDSGWVTLSGNVDWPYQKRAAEDAVRRLTGVTGVTNDIHVKPTIMPTDVKAKIESAFQRNAVLDARRIGVDARDSKVILTGVVRSLAEKEEAEEAAGAAPGVTAVDNRLVVTP